MMFLHTSETGAHSRDETLDERPKRFTVVPSQPSLLNSSRSSPLRQSRPTRRVITLGRVVLAMGVSYVPGNFN
jgi:hypothetical protein